MVNLRSRGFWLRFIPILVVFLADVFFLAFLDTILNIKKKSIIIDSEERWKEITQHKDVDILNKGLTKLYYDPPGSQQRNSNYTELAKEYLIQNASTVVNGDNPFVSIRLSNEEGEVVYETFNQEKSNQLNHWKNSLFSRSFISFIGNTSYQMKIGYATPEGFEKIEEAAWQYKQYAVMFVIFTWLLYFMLTRSVVSPLLKVDHGIERIIRTGNVSLIPHPKNETEIAFNQLMRTQREVFIGAEVDHTVDQLHHITDDHEVITQFLHETAKRIPNVYPFASIDVYVHHNNQWNPISSNQTNSFTPEFARKPVYINSYNQLCIRIHHNDNVVGAFCCKITDGELVDAEERVRMGTEIEKHVSNGISRCIGRSRTLTEERNRFGINIATNMGHDLTNIIASGKWDLDTISRAQSLGIIQTDEQKGKYYTEAVDGLHNNLHFLQEMVDIYRSFAHTQHPHFESADLSELTTDIAQLFKRSTSKKLHIDVSVPETVEAFIEPRLLRMALFNLMNNAAQAIVQSDPPIANGHISVSLTVEDGQQASILVQDNGPGIRNEARELLSEKQINRIFQSGYSTKGKSSGGGLGLSWVRSIVNDFHQGGIQAKNHPNGGAVFTITLPLNLDSKKETPHQE